MKQYPDIIQRTPAWYDLRLGRITASSIDTLVTPMGKISKAAGVDEYRCRLLAEFFLKEPMDKMVKTYWMERGADLEKEAADLYELTTGMDTKPIGFVTTDDGSVGCSPDRFVGADGMCEIKCPAPWTHIWYMLNQEQFKKDYYPQFQCQLWVCERKWMDFFSYYPKLPPVRVRMERDEGFIEVLRCATADFMTKYEEMKIKALEAGCVERPAPQQQEAA